MAKEMQRLVARFAATPLMKPASTGPGTGRPTDGPRLPASRRPAAAMSRRVRYGRRRPRGAGPRPVVVPTAAHRCARAPQGPRRQGAVRAHGCPHERPEPQRGRAARHRARRARRGRRGRERPAQHRGAGPAHRRARRRRARLRPAAAPARRQRGQRDHGQRPRMRSTSSAAASWSGPRRGSPPRSICAGSSTASSPRWDGGSTSRPRWSTLAWPTDPRRDHPAAGVQRVDASRSGSSPGPFTVEDLIASAPSPRRWPSCSSLLRGRLNVIVSGGTGTGKTTLLNVLSSFIPEGERIVTIEDAVELQLQQEHVVRLSPAAQHRGQGCGQHPRPGAQLAPHAARPHRRR